MENKCEVIGHIQRTSESLGNYDNSLKGGFSCDTCGILELIEEPGIGLVNVRVSKKEIENILGQKCIVWGRLKEWQKSAVLGSLFTS